MNHKMLLPMLLFTVFVGCKKEEEKTGDVQMEAPAVVTFTLNAIVKETDDFQLFYQEHNNFDEPFDEVASVWVGANGSEAAQDIVMVLPEDAYPTRIRLDFGHNKNQPEIQIKSFTVNYKGKKMAIAGADFFNYFDPNPAFVKIDPAAATVTPIVTPQGLYDPLFISNEKFNLELAELLK